MPKAALQPSPGPSPTAPERSGAAALALGLLLLGAPLAPAQEAPREAPAATLTTEVIHPGQDLDWVPIGKVPEALRNRLCRLCGGRYIDPLAGSVNDPQQDPERSDIEAEAARSELIGDNVHLEGGVRVRQGYRRLGGDEVDIDRVSRAGTLEGNIVVREPGLLLRGSRGAFYSRTGEAQLEDSRFVLHRQHMHGEAALLSRDADELIRVEDGRVSYCAPGDTTWLLSARQISLDLERGVGVARNARLEIADRPVLFLPWISFPLDNRRRTGFLFPTFTNDSRGGIDIGVPIYFNLAPNYDLSYSPRYLERRGIANEAQARYLDRWNGNWQAGGSYLGGDDQYATDAPEDQDSDRWLAQLLHRGLYDARWRTNIDYTRVSDVDLIRDLETNNLEIRREVNLMQRASVDYLGDQWLVNAEVQRFQPLAEDIREDYRKLPQITLRYRGGREPFRLNRIFEAQYSLFDSKLDVVTGQRLYGEAGLSYPMRWTSGFLDLTAKYRYLAYQIDDPRRPDNNTPSSGAPLVNADAGLYLERRTRLFGQDWQQTLEPRIYYLWSAYEEQRDQPDFDSAELTFTYNQLFRMTRFSGRDRLDDANQVSLGVATRFFSGVDGSERFNASLGQIYYLDNRRVRLNPDAPELERSNSEMAGEVNFYPNDRFAFRSRAQWDTESGKVNAGNLFGSYRREDGTLMNIGYTYRREFTLVGDQPPTDQAHLSAVLPINDRWRTFFAWNYSFEADRAVEDMLGFEYDNCCWTVRLLHLRYFDTARGVLPDFDSPNLERENALQVQFVLKGLGGFGNRVEQLMTDMIRGYSSRGT